jgi:hypothetical protein
LSKLPGRSLRKLPSPELEIFGCRRAALSRRFWLLGSGRRGEPGDSGNGGDECGSGSSHGPLVSF